jgi:hypothetical protein
MFTKNDLQEFTTEELLNMNSIIVDLIKERKKNITIDKRIKEGCTVEVDTGKGVAGFPSIEKFIVVKIKLTKAVCRVLFDEKLYDINLNAMKFYSKKSIDKC